MTNRRLSLFDGSIFRTQAGINRGALDLSEDNCETTKTDTVSTVSMAGIQSSLLP